VRKEVKLIQINYSTLIKKDGVLALRRHKKQIQITDKQTINQQTLIIALTKIPTIYLYLYRPQLQIIAR